MKFIVTSHEGVKGATVSLTEELIMNFVLIISSDFIVIFHYGPQRATIRGEYCCISGCKCTVFV